MTLSKPEHSWKLLRTKGRLHLIRNSLKTQLDSFTNLYNHERQLKSSHKLGIDIGVQMGDTSISHYTQQQLSQMQDIQDLLKFNLRNKMISHSQMLHFITRLSEEEIDFKSAFNILSNYPF